MTMVKGSIFSGLLIFSTFFSWAQTHYEEMTVAVKQLHVNVVDNKGNPVPGLTARDFEVLLEGKPQEIESVFPISLESQVSETGQISPPEAIPEYGRRMFMLVFDVEFNNSNDIIRARRAAYDFIKEDMLDTDLVSLFTLSRSQIRMVINFTSDRAQLENALYAFGTDRGDNEFSMDTGFYAREYWERQDTFDHTRSGPNEERSSQTGLEGLNIPFGGREEAAAQLGDQLLQLEGSFRQRMTTEAIGYMDNFKGFAESLSVISGRKNLILFSSSFDGSLALGLSGEKGGARSASSSMGRADGMISGQTLDAAQRMIEALQGSGAVVFAIDTSAAGMMSQKSSLHMLNNFSSSTGGRMFANARDMGKALRQIKTITSQYYLVNIRPNLVLKKGELASVKIKVDRPKVKVYTSKGLLLEPDFQRLDPFERKLMLSEYVSRDIIALPMPVEMDVVQVPMKGDLSRLNVAVQLEGSFLLDTPDPNLAREFELFLLAVEKGSNRLVSQHYHSFAVIPESSRAILEKTGLSYFGDLGVPDGSYKIKLILRNLENGRTTSLIRDIEVKHQSLASQPLGLTQIPWLEIKKTRTENSSNDDLIQLGPKTDTDPFPYKFAQGAQFLPTASRILNPSQQATFLFLVEGEAAAANGEAVSMAAVITDGKGGNQIAQPANLRFKLFQAMEEGRAAGLVLALDLSAFKLEKGRDYTLLTRINLGNQPPALAQYAFSVAQ